MDTWVREASGCVPATTFSTPGWRKLKQWRVPVTKPSYFSLPQNSHLSNLQAPKLVSPKTRGITKFQICMIVIQATAQVHCHRPCDLLQKLFIIPPWRHVTGSPGGYIKCPVLDYGKVAVLTWFWCQNFTFPRVCITNRSHFNVQILHLTTSNVSYKRTF